jgi:ABC-2 type transport system ATP-binding protein
MMIEAVSLEHAFGSRRVLKGVSFGVKEGEIFGVVGPDGAGKTTLVRVLTGVLHPKGGTVRLLGSLAPEKARERVGVIPQAFTLYGDLTVWENIRLYGSMYGADPAEAERRGKEILAFTNLLPFGDRLADALSGGMKRKLAVAAGLLHSPQVFILDEPTTGVDPVSRREIWGLLYQLNRSGLTILVTTPYMDEAELCTRAAFLNEGSVMACGTPKALCEGYPWQILELSVPLRDVKPYLAGVPLREVLAFGTAFHLVVEDAASAEAAVREALSRQDIPVLSMRRVPPTLEDVFVELAGKAA